ncbi:unnamed protein product [Lupinus luteus]|uniref:Uncharacterized protein n=1 Tax=Lupinus luteus TaxID=3873 RepID=A0AAV1XWN7_LUPLU
MERITSPNIVPAIDEERENLVSQSQDMDIVEEASVDQVLVDDHALIQNNQSEAFEVLDHVPTTNALAVQESRLVGHLWADEEETETETENEVGNEIIEETSYTKK